ncbi:MAG: DnaA/Hda family protein [bacterium]|nr:DnaA/Hda family protein [bacterium]
MNENDIKEFQETFGTRQRSRETSELPDNPFLKAELSYAVSSGTLTSKVIVLESTDNSAEIFADKMAESISSSFPDFYIFRIDLKEMVELMKFATLSKYKRFLLYSNLLIIENLEQIEKNSVVYDAIIEIINSLHATSYLLVTTKKKLEEISIDLKTRNFLMSGKFFSTGGKEEKKENDPIRDFSDFISQVKQEAGVQENLNEGEKREEFIEKLYIWEMKGFNVERLKNVINDNDISLIRKEFSEFTDKIKELVELHKDYGLLNIKEFKKESKEIEEILFDPDKLDIIKEKTEALKEKIRYLRFFRNSIRLSMMYESFITDATNRTAYNKITEIINNENAEKIVILTGTNGTGKTHLLNSICNHFIENRIILIDKTNVDLAVNNSYVMRYMDDLSMVLIDDFDILFENKANKAVLKNIIMNNVPKVVSMYRKFSIDDRELLNHLNKFQSFNLQPTSLFIKKNVFKAMFANLGIQVNDFLMNYMLDSIESPLSAVEDQFKELALISPNRVPTIESIDRLFPQAESKKTASRKKSEYDTSQLIKEWINEHDRLYVEFEV